MARRHRKPQCMYCGRPAGTTEHIIATRFIEVLGEDPRGLRRPTTLNITLSSGTRRRIGGKRTKRRHHTLEYTTRVCNDCNGGWMNDLDSTAYPYVAEMIRGRSIALDRRAQSAIAAWFCKICVTARSEPHNPLPIEKEWTDWLYNHHSAPPDLVRLGRTICGEATVVVQPSRCAGRPGPRLCPAAAGVRSHEWRTCDHGYRLSHTASLWDRRPWSAQYPESGDCFATHLARVQRCGDVAAIGVRR
jgi:hypothetical protein